MYRQIAVKVTVHVPSNSHIQNKNLRSFHKDEHEDVLKVNIETNMRRGSKRPATADLCRIFAYDKKNVGIINKEVTN